jgi:hypothetical protein
VIAIAQHTCIAGEAPQFRQHALALAQRRLREIESFEINQIEDVKDQTRTAALIDRILQP